MNLCNVSVAVCKGTPAGFSSELLLQNLGSLARAHALVDQIKLSPRKPAGCGGVTAAQIHRLHLGLQAEVALFDLLVSAS